MTTATRAQVPPRTPDPSGPSGLPAEPTGLSAWAGRHRSLLLGTLGGLIVLVAWQVCASTGAVDVSFSSSPILIAKAEGTLFGSGDRKSVV